MKRFCSHDWSKWSDPFGSCCSDSKLCQARRCNKCGKIYLAYVKSPWNWWFHASVLLEKLNREQP